VCGAGCRTAHAAVEAIARQEAHTDAFELAGPAVDQPPLPNRTALLRNQSVFDRLYRPVHRCQVVPQRLKVAVRQ
jgi:hypothetical protein